MPSLPRAAAVAMWGACLAAMAAPVPASARQHAPSSRGTLLDVPYLAQPPQLCGGAALAMVLRYWGGRDVFPEDFAPLVEADEGGIRTGALGRAASERGWRAFANVSNASAALEDLEEQVAKGRPAIALIDEGLTRYHYVVVTGLTPSHVIVHDPARAPFRMVPRETFRRVWEIAGRWFMIVLPADPPDQLSPEPSAESPPTATSVRESHSCAELVKEQVALATRGELARADAGLQTAVGLCPASASAWRELAGLRFVQRRYEESAALAARATFLGPRDRSTLELLAAARFMNRDPHLALEAWNRLDEPRIDTITIQGLRRTNHSVIADHLRLSPRRLLTPDLFGRAERRLAELPSVSSSRLTYQPSPDGTAAITAATVEGHLVPRGAVAWSVAGLSTAVRRDLQLEVTSPFHEGDVWQFAYRFAPKRPRVRFGVALPSRGSLPGITKLEALWEGQSYAAGPDNVLQPTEIKRRRLSVGVSDWATARIRWQVGAAWDRFDEVDRFISIETRVVARSLGDQAAATAEFGHWIPTRRQLPSFRSGSLLGEYRSRPETDGSRVAVSAGLAWTSASAPLPLWHAAGSSDTRGVLLRAHPLFDDGVINNETLGRRLAHGTIEYERPLARHMLGTIGLAAFVDAARASRRILPGSSPLHVDVGIGGRIDAPSIPGRLRADVARGLRDGRTTLSAGIVSSWGR